MALPAFNEAGDLPPGIHPSTLGEILQRFAQGSIQRWRVAARLERIYGLAKETGRLSRFLIFGSFVTSKTNPNDVDIFMLMDDSFDSSTVTGEAELLFSHMEAEALFGASIFWTRRSGALGGERAMLEFWQERRQGGKRGIVEIISERP